MASFADDLGLIEDDDSAPIFPCEPPDGLRHLSELDRVVTFRRLMRQLAPRVMVYANANAGKRSRRQASAEGIVAGVFDYTVAWNHGVAWPEFKGYDSRGRPGKLSQPQIDWGNAMSRIGHPVACFYSPVSAVEWLRGIGCPFSGRVTA